jgi:hypothetical protein
MGHTPAIHTGHFLAPNYDGRLESGVSCAHDGLAKIIDTVGNMGRMGEMRTLGIGLVHAIVITT